MNAEPELNADERNALRDWALCDPPTDFAQRVLVGVARTSHERTRLVVNDARRQTSAVWWMGVTVAAAAMLLALGIIATRHDAGDDSARVASLRSQARDALLAHCTPCHLKAIDAGDAAAGSVFDASDAFWEQQLSSSQLVVALDRVAERGTERQVAGFRDFVSAELQRRDGLWR